MPNKDYYKILGVPKTATVKDIKAAYRKLAMKYHPDKLKDGTSDQKMQELNEAYDVLGDPKKRANYDKFGTDNPKANGFGGMKMGDFMGEGFTVNFGDIFNDIFGGMGGPHQQQSARAGASAKEQSAPKKRGADLLKNITISFDDVMKGSVYEDKLTKWSVCPSCHGAGAMSKDIKLCAKCKGSGKQVVRKRTPFGITEMITGCPDCHGTGKVIVKPCPECRGKQYIKKTKTVNVIISKGVDDDDRIKLPGFGEKGENGGPVGDMYVVIHVKPHKYFARNGLDLMLSPFPVSFISVINETDILVPTPNGNQTITLSKAYNSGQLIRLKGYGLTNKDGKKGDLILRLEIVIPDLSKSQLEEIGGLLSKYPDKTNDDYVKKVNE